MNITIRIYTIIFTLLFFAVPVCRAQAPSSPPQPESCDVRIARENADWGRTEHSWIGSVFHKQHIDLSQTWCRIGEAHGYDKVTKIEDFGRVVFTGEGLHPTAGGIVPGSGLAGGLSFNLQRALQSAPIRTFTNLEARGSTKGFWVAGGKLKLLGSSANAKDEHISATFSIKHYSLPQLHYFGIGNSTSRADETLFGLENTRLAAAVEIPLRAGFSVAAITEGLWESPSGFHGVSTPSIEQKFTPVDTPALNTDTSYFVYGGGISWKYPLEERLRGYRTSASTLFRVFHETGGEPFSFRRFEVTWAQQYNPDTSFDFGTFSLVSRLVESIATGGDNVPFYLQPTLGGRDIDGVGDLRSYADYRFRAPNTISFRAGYERSIKDPLGFLFFYDVGKVAVRRGDLSLNHMKHSFGTGLAIRVGGFSVVQLYYAWGGGEGSRTVFSTNTNTLGGNGNLQGVF